ncbi:MAG TPA: helix-turn-helix transcriptional regulator [Thermoanaerobaculia bacterium]|nr:helix-turn-helix transcriptional regulator [Thermoanaerobaculia bacterium]
MDQFGHVGETLRRLRKELGKTLSQLGAEAKVGKGQLSRIENGHQEATLGTLAKILAAHGISRHEFFRRYDLVEAETTAAREGKSAPPVAGLGSGGRLADSVRDALDRFDAFVRMALEGREPLAQGAFELGAYVVFFRVVPRTEGSTAGQSGPPSPP